MQSSDQRGTARNNADPKTPRRDDADDTPARQAPADGYSTGEFPTGGYQADYPVVDYTTGDYQAGQLPNGQYLPSHKPLRSRSRTVILFTLALISGVLMSVVFHYLQYRGMGGMTLSQTRYNVSAMSIGVDLCLGILALALLPSAIRHDPLERLDTYVGPPSALVASLVILCLWLVSTLAAPAGAVVLISVSARLSKAWTAAAFAASVLSLVVNQLTTFGAGGLSSLRFVLGGCVLTLILIGMGSVRGVLLRRE